MKARISFAAAAVVLMFVSQASASVISASSQTARSKPADKVDYLSVTSIQKDLNTAMREVADASAPTALGPRSAPETASGGFLLGAEPANRSGSGDVTGRAIDSLFRPDQEKGASAIKRDIAGPGTVIANGSHGGGWGNHNGGRHGGKNSGGVGTTGGHKKDGGWVGGRTGGGGIQAAPEPSTWLLLGVGLTMVGIYEVVRRRS
jgi:hypothetical protein